MIKTLTDLQLVIPHTKNLEKGSAVNSDCYIEILISLGKHKILHYDNAFPHTCHQTRDALE